VNLWDRNLLWYLALFTTLTAMLRGLVPAEEDLDPLHNPNIQMRRVASFTHLYPSHWRGRAETYDVKEAFESLLPNRVVILMRELMCVACTPYM
jgi:hypothetical protein